ncbi:MAG: AgmX/PglI C-terminal domain-containing protein [Polyangiaceae bacterium]|nr:AgmX/PglI C-terminal domain-containing protein [Polyangiaceae bacterium]
MAYSNPFLAGSPLASPFAPVAAQDYEVPADAPEGSYTYALVKSAPEVPAEEVESAAAAIEISIKWGDSLLHVAHLAPPRAFYVGEEERKNVACDYFLPAEKLGGATRAPLLVISGGAAHAVILPGAKGTIEIGGQKMTVEQAIASGAAPCVEVAGAHQIALPMGAKARLALGDFTFELSAVNAGRAAFGKVRIDKRSLPFTALSMALHLSVLGAAAFFMPPMAMADEDGVSSEQQYLMQMALQASAEREADQPKDDSTASATPGASEGGTGARAMNEEGKMGSQTSTRSDGRFGIYGPKDNTDVRISKAQALRDAADFGMIGLLNAGGGGDPNAIHAPWGGLDTLGNDPKSALGNMWGTSIDEAGGAGGLGLTGIGEGGGGRFQGVGLGAVGTIGHGSGLGDGQGFGPGSGASTGRFTRGHKVASPRMTVGSTQVSGRIPPEVIQRIVRQNFGRFRLCYENGLRNNPSLQGRVAVAFVIGRDGAVSSVQNGGSDLPEPSVVSCVVRSFYGLSFPAPDGGIVTVSYPIMFTPGG